MGWDCRSANNLTVWGRAWLSGGQYRGCGLGKTNLAHQLRAYEPATLEVGVDVVGKAESLGTSAIRGQEVAARATGGRGCSDSTKIRSREPTGGGGGAEVFPVEGGGRWTPGLWQLLSSS